MACAFWNMARGLILAISVSALFPASGIYLDFAAAVPSGAIYAGVPLELIATLKVTTREAMTRKELLEQRGFNPRVKWQTHKGTFTNATTGAVLGDSTLPPNGLVFVNRSTYLPPAVPGEYTLSVIPEADPSKAVTLTITVEELFLKLQPSAVRLAPNQDQAFVAMFRGPSLPALAWSTTGGQVTPQGRYTAPPEPGVHTVTVQHIPTGKRASALVTVTNPFRIQPTVLELAPGQSARFQAAGNLEVLSWSVQEPGGGTIDTDGTYTAPSRAGTFSIQASTPSGRASATAHVSPLAISISPLETTLGTGQRVQFEAAINQGAFHWSATEGEISEEGLFHAPLKFGIYQVTATSTLDPEVHATATIHVDAMELMQVVPEELTLHIGQTQQFTVPGLLGDTLLSWSVQPPTAGSITESGLFTAGPTPGPCSIMALLEDQVSTAAVTLIDTRILPDPAQVKPGGSLQFSVQGMPKEASVAWSLEPASAGNLSSEGLLTAGNKPGNYRILATAGDVEASASLRILASRISPEAALLAPGGTVHFTCDRFDAPGQSLVWRLEGDQPGAFLGQDGTYRAPNRQGIYRISASDAAGTAAQATVTVGPPEGLMVVPELRIEQDGIYTVWVRLKASNGHFVDGRFTGELQRGLAYPEIAFPARRLLLPLGVDGPYAIARLWVTGTLEEESILFDARENLGQTDAFSLEESTKAWIRIGEITEIRGQGRDAKGLLESLQVTIPVELITDGEYRFQATLAAEDGTNIDTCSESRTCTRGNQAIVLTFDGRKIHAWGGAGPLLIARFTVEGPVTRSWAFLGSIKGYDSRMFQP